MMENLNIWINEADNSIIVDSFDVRDASYKGDFSSQTERIYYYLLCNGEGKTSNELSKELNIRINAICGRINELRKKEIVGVIGKKIDPVTGKLNIVWGAI